ncbi:MAG: ISNCY-like element ISTde1 family transposase [Treponemataceae bacterium]|nr:MAG: ISNCY-like element ISTde1 family transposase [Treponemataceae bacterium]
MIHGNVGKESNHKIKADTRRSVLQAYRERYEDFGPTFAKEKLAEIEGIKVSVSTVRRWLLEEGLWTRERRSSEYRSRRDRRESFGELIQFDGSHHRWFEGRGLKCCLITLIDDATNTRLSQFFEEETTAGAMEVLKLWIGKYGIPQALYCDKKNAFVLTREPTDAELLKGITKPKSHFGKACGKLGIEVIAANSPQAKGRVERNHGLDQDRLVKELRLAGISTIETANKFLLETYLPKINAMFSKPAKSPQDAHIPLFNTDLSNVFCFEYERTVTNDYIVRFECRLFQILKTNQRLPHPKNKVTVCIKLDNS